MQATAITEDETLWTWGVWIGMTGVQLGAPPVHILDDAVTTSLGFFHSMTVTEDGGLWAWGKRIFTTQSRNA